MTSAHGPGLTISLAGREIAAAELVRMAPSEIGMLLLSELVDRPKPEWSLHSARVEAEVSAREEWRRESGQRGEHPEYTDLDFPQLLADALAWLISRGLVGPASQNSGGAGEWRVTTDGRAAAEAGTAARAEAAMRLHADLHPALEEARSNFERGSYQAAVFEATRQVEVRVRDLAAMGPDSYGVKLMRAAFNPQTGPLATGEVLAEQEAIASLFAGTIGAFKNAAGHRVVHFDDPTEAADIIHLADLLLRIAERQTALGS